MSDTAAVFQEPSTNHQDVAAPKISKRDFIAQFDDTQRELVTIPEWGNVILEVRGMSGIERAHYIQVMQNLGEEEDGGITQLYPALLIHTVYDPDNGARVFNEGDEDMLNSKAGVVLERLAQLSIKLSGMASGQEDEAGKASSSPEN
jgi:hypothetical protein